MELSFKGFKNIGAGISTNETASCRRLVFQLTNDGSKDLTNAKVIFDQFPDPLNKGFVKIDCLTYTDSFKRENKAFLLNNQYLEESKENMPIFAQIAKWAKKIYAEGEVYLCLKLPSPFPLETEYLKSTDCLKNFDIDSFEQFKGTVEGAHSFTNIINSAQSIGEKVEKIFGNFIDLQ